MFTDTLDRRRGQLPALPVAGAHQQRQAQADAADLSKDSDIIVDVITARQDDIKANPVKYQNFLKGIYKAVQLYKTDPTKFIATAAPHFNLTPAEVKDVLDTSLVYCDLATAAADMGTPDKPGKLSGIFDTVMQLNLENGAADTKLDAAKQIDSSVMAAIAAGK